MTEERVIKENGLGSAEFHEKERKTEDKIGEIGAWETLIT